MMPKPAKRPRPTTSGPVLGLRKIISAWIRLPDDLAAAVWQQDFSDDGRTISTQRVANPLVQFRESDARVFFAGEHQERAGIFLGTARCSLDGAFANENDGPLEGRKLSCRKPGNRPSSSATLPASPRSRS